VAGDPRGEIPCIGASGGISGIITFYALQFPHARLGLFVRYHWVNFPAWAALVLWAALQAVGVAQQLAGFSNVSALAHMGGAALGLLAWAAWRAKRVA
jgi:membrane associated rhomboid family serine protease